MVSALGNLKAPWEVSATQKFTPRQSHPPEPHRPFSVGRSRAQNMLNMALATKDDKAKVRRLDQALETPCVRYERAATPRLFQVSHEAQQVRRHLAKENAWAEKTTTSGPPKKAAPTPEEIQKEEEQAALRIQSLYRGGKDREAVKKMAQQEAEAATKIQSVFRGQAARRELKTA